MANRAAVNKGMDLVMWQKLMSYVTEVYRLTDLFPVHEVYGLGSDMRRSALRTPQCVAQGYGTCSKSDYIRFMNTAEKSLGDILLLLEKSLNLDYVKRNDVERLSDCSREIGKMLKALKKTRLVSKVA